MCGRYGHLGDANLHLNIALENYDESVREKIEPFVYEVTSDLKGSISAEHGLGVMKGEHIHYSKSPEMVQLFGRIKTMFDPNGIMNPYKYLPQASSHQSTATANTSSAINNADIVSS